MFEEFTRLPETYQGIISLLVGFIFLCYALDIIVTGINILIIAFSIYLIGMGFLKSGLYHQSLRIINKFAKQQQKKEIGE